MNSCMRAKGSPDLTLGVLALSIRAMPMLLGF